MLFHLQTLSFDECFNSNFTAVGICFMAPHGNKHSLHNCCCFRVAAEWILRCGGAVKFKNFEKWIQNYNAIPDGPKGKFFLEAISAKGISVTTGGLQHLDGLQHLRLLNVNSCVYVTNMNKLLPVKESLEELDIGNCVAISDISPLFELKKLRKLVLTNTPKIKQREETIASLQKRLPDCVIEE
ncbi:unnamed protein product [Pocillopora meandrina]|uniref:ATP synthase subunit s, mitochondrial n=1 Tax=Pocillopora meandrina TaxID=46732 RepID=A0AAU9W1H3_9CNID|nr:unnamed protein product [Pocillopora meandrina]